MERRPHRRPVWRPGTLSRLNAFLKVTLRTIAFRNTALAILALPLCFYVYREITRDVLIIDPFTVPRHFEEAGLTSDVMANRIGDRLQQIEMVTHTRMKKDNLTSVRDEGLMPDVEIPGTKMGLKTVVDIARSVFGIYPKHISGDIVFPMNAESPLEKQQSAVTVTVYLTQGRNRNASIGVVIAADDIEILTQGTAETVLGQVNPYVLAAYRMQGKEYAKAIEIVESIVQSPSADRLYRQAALNLWGYALEEQRKYDEAIVKYQKAIELDPKDVNPYLHWGNVLVDQKKYDEAIAKYQRAIELDPKDAFLYSAWGNMLVDQKKYDEAIAKYQRAIELDPKEALFYNRWGEVLVYQKKYDEGIAKFQKAIEIDPKYARSYLYWGLALADQENYDEAIAKYDKAIELDPEDACLFNDLGSVLSISKQGAYAKAVAKHQKAIELTPKSASFYTAWGNLLSCHKEYGEAIAKYQKAIELDPRDANPYHGWGNVLRAQGKHGEASAKFNKAAEISRSQ